MFELLFNAEINTPKELIVVPQYSNDTLLFKMSHFMQFFVTTHLQEDPNELKKLIESTMVIATEMFERCSIDIMLARFYHTQHTKR